MRFVYSRKRIQPSTPAIFIDRDGVINHRRAGNYILEWSQFIFVSGIREALRELTLLRLPMIVVSNQSAVGRGLLKPSILENITSRMQQALSADGAPLAAVYYCTHKPDDRCACRKPKPEMLHKAAGDFNIDLCLSVFIGDSDADVQAAQLAGCQPILFGPGLTECSETLDWKTGVPIAQNATELYRVTAKVLKTPDHGSS